MGGWTWDDWDVYVMKSDGTKLRRISQQAYYGLAAPRFSRDGNSVVYSAMGRSPNDLRSTVFEMNVAGGQPPKLLIPGERASRLG
jgi:hypothetical protein